MHVVLVAMVCLAQADAGDSWNVSDYGAVADASADATAAFQAAMDAAAAAGGGIVTVPTGRYRFDGALTVPDAVTLRGVYRYAPSHAGIRDAGQLKPDYGTVFRVHGGAGDAEGTPFITLRNNASLQGVCVYYPDQDPDAAEPTAYPFAIAMRGNNPSVIDVELLNPYKGIDASKNQRALIRNVHGQPLALGIYVDVVYDIGRIENVHWNPWWSMKGAYKWQMENGRAFVFGRTDWHYVLNTFCYGYNIGYHFIKTEAGMTNGNFLGIGADDCYTALEVEDSARWGILITNGEFVAFNGPSPTMVRVRETNSGSVRFVNCAFWGPSHRIAEIAGSGTVGFSDSTFCQWGHGDEPEAAIQARGGSVLIRGCEFQEAKPHVYLGAGLKRAIVSENLVRGEPHILNESDGQVVISNNLGD